MSMSGSELSQELNKILSEFPKPLNVKDELPKIKSTIEGLLSASQRVKRELFGALIQDATKNSVAADFLKLKNFAEILKQCCDLSFRKSLNLSKDAEELLEEFRDNSHSDWVEGLEMPAWSSSVLSKPVPSVPTSGKSEVTAKPEVTRFGTRSKGGMQHRRIVELEEQLNALRLELIKANKRNEMLELIKKSFGLKDGIDIETQLKAALGSPLPKIEDLKLALELKKVMEKEGLRVDSAQHLQEDIAKLKDAQRKLDLVTKERDSLKTQLENVTKERDAALLQVKNLTKERDDALKQVTLLTQERDGLKIQLENVAKERDAALLQVKNLTKERDDALKQVTLLSKERDELKTQLYTVSKERDGLKTRLLLAENAIQSQQAVLQVARQEAVFQVPQPQTQISQPPAPAVLHQFVPQPQPTVAPAPTPAPAKKRNPMDTLMGHH